MPTNGTISIWRLCPDALTALAELTASRRVAVQGLLSEEEARRGAAFHAEEDSCLYIAAHAALRIALGRLLNLSPASLEFTGENGVKPVLLGQSRTSPSLRFSLSHTRRAVLIATAFDCEVGIDIEHHRPIDDLESLADGIMSPAERAVWAGLAPASRVAAFYRLWTRKEAYLKAIGLGLFRDLQAITVPVTAHDLTEPALVDDRREALQSPHWHLCDLPVWDDFSAALCWQAASPLSGQPQLEIRDLSVDDLMPT